MLIARLPLLWRPESERIQWLLEIHETLVLSGLLKSLTRFLCSARSLLCLSLRLLESHIVLIKPWSCQGCCMGLLCSVRRSALLCKSNAPSIARSAASLPGQGTMALPRVAMVAWGADNWQYDSHKPGLATTLMQESQICSSWLDCRRFFPEDPALKGKGKGRGGKSKDKGMGRGGPRPGAFESEELCPVCNFPQGSCQCQIPFALPIPLPFVAIFAQQNRR